MGWESILAMMTPRLYLYEIPQAANCVVETGSRRNMLGLLSMARMKRIVLAIAIILIVWVVGCGCYPFVQWSALNRSNRDVDINTGRFRHQRYLLGICIDEGIEESLLSRTLDPTETSPIWQRCTTI